MGRAGRGSGGGSRSSGGHSSSRRSGGHRVSSSRSGSSRSSRSYSSSSRSYSNHRSNHGGGSYRGYSSTRGTLIGISFFLLMIMIYMCAVFLLYYDSIPKSTYQREKINTDVAFENDCIVDELGWFDNEARTEKELQYFYEKTGIQPYIVLHQYDSSLWTSIDKENWANDYYENNIDDESTFLYVYFAEETEDGVGYMCYVNGKQITSVMDSEALDIFWGYIDNNWYKDISTDDVFVDTFNSTADTIMTKSLTTTELISIIVISVALLMALYIVLKLVRAKHLRDKEKAEETERILSTPLHELSDDQKVDDIVDKYE